ncbi:MAG TPA: DJ-1/PfpI family protein [Acidimicrobiales bacterium]|nr:DJ-1/PfpI family protein [Acidimicrobiales bacterium]
MLVAIPLFDRFTALDAVGPYEVLCRLPGTEVTFVGERVGPVRTDTGMLALTIDSHIDEIDAADVLLVPGGPGTRAMLEPGPLHAWVRRIHETTQWTTSVCTGSLILGTAGVLQGLEATTHWAAMDELAPLCARTTHQRIVPQGKVVTAAGVSAGIDMALWLVGQIAGDVVAQAIQLGIEYDPQPPFDAGSPEKAGPDLVALLRDLAIERPKAEA